MAPKGAETRLVIYPKAIMQGSENTKASIVFQCEDVTNTYEKLKANGVVLRGTTRNAMGEICSI